MALCHENFSIQRGFSTFLVTPSIASSFWFLSAFFCIGYHYRFWKKIYFLGLVNYYCLVELFCWQSFNIPSDLGPRRIDTTCYDPPLWHYIASIQQKIFRSYCKPPVWEPLIPSAPSTCRLSPTDAGARAAALWFSRIHISCARAANGPLGLPRPFSHYNLWDVLIYVFVQQRFLLIPEKTSLMLYSL